MMDDPLRKVIAEAMVQSALGETAIGVHLTEHIATAVRAFLGSEEVVAKAAQAIADDLRSRSVYVSDDLRNCLVDGGLFDLHDPARAALSSIMEAPDAES